MSVDKGPYKLIHRLDNGASELYNVETDISESDDLSEQKPEVAVGLLRQLQEWEPTRNNLADLRKRTHNPR